MSSLGISCGLWKEFATFIVRHIRVLEEALDEDFVRMLVGVREAASTLLSWKL